MDKPSTYYQCEREEMLAYVPDDARVVLDVGCGAGRFGALVKATRGAAVWGVEPDEVAANEAALALDRVIHGSYPDAMDGDGTQFDCVIFNDVLEHMVDPWATLRDTRKFLLPGGRVVASIPNVRYLPHLYKLVVRGQWNYTTSGVLDRDHVRFFTRASIVEMFRQAGYEVQTIEPIHPDVHWQTRLLKSLPGVWREVAPLEFAVVAQPR